MFFFSKCLENEWITWPIFSGKLRDGESIVICFFRFVFFEFPVLSIVLAISHHFGAGSCHFNNICSIFEFEPFVFHGICNILVLFAACSSWKLPFQRCICSIFENLQHFSARTVHVDSMLVCN